MVFYPHHELALPLIPPLVQVSWHSSPFSNGDNVRGRDFVITEGDPVEDLNEDELYSRAWLLQEQLLVSHSNTLEIETELIVGGATHAALSV